MMRPMDFDESNKTLTAPQGMTDEEVGPLPVYADGGQCVSCWRPSLRERFQILIFGRVWLYVMGTTQPPIAIEGRRTGFES